MYYLSLHSIVKQEAAYIAEWIDFHIAMGVEHFYIYDNESADNLVKALYPYIIGNIVTYKFFPGSVKQMDSYYDVLYNHQIESRWVGFIDIDEFLLPTTGNLPNFLSEFENYAGLSVNWLCYGSSGYLFKQNGLVTKTYLYRSEKDRQYNKHVKSIVDPSRVFGISGNPHSFFYRPGFYAVNESLEETPGPLSEVNRTEKIRINHYFTKSKQEFTDKVNRGRSDCAEKRTISEFDEFDDNSVYDPIASKVLRG